MDRGDEKPRNRPGIPVSSPISAEIPAPLALQASSSGRRPRREGPKPAKRPRGSEAAARARRSRPQIGAVVCATASWPWSVVQYPAPDVAQFSGGPSSEEKPSRRPDLPEHPSGDRANRANEWDSHVGPDYPRSAYVIGRPPPRPPPSSPSIQEVRMSAFGRLISSGLRSP